MTVTLADKSGFCFGVKRAVDEALSARQKFNKKIYTLGPLIHNVDVVNYLKDNDIFPISVEDINKLNKDDVIIIRSHGVSKELLNCLIDKDIHVINATCPYVSNIQEKADKYYNLGYKIVIVGDKNHPEVVGINGWCNNEALISKNGMDIDHIPQKVCVLSQTTEKQENWEKVLNVLVKESKEILAFNTICSATSVRQKSAQNLSKNVDIMIVIGGKNSSNTTKLYEICKKNCINTIHVENSGEIPDEIIKNKNNLNIGVTAGASTPDWIIKEAILKMNDNEKTEINEQLAFMEKNDNQIVVGETVKGEIISIGEKQAFLNIGYKIDGILPLEEVTKDENVRLSDILQNGQSLDVKVISRRNEDGYVVLSRIELEREAAFKEIKEAKENNTVLSVLVKQAVNGGLVGSYKGVRIFIPASHVELYHVDDLKSYEGKQLEVKIIEVKEERRSTRIVGSRRDILKAEKSQRDQETWDKLEKDTVVEGEVKRITDFGAFVDIDGIDGLLHVSEISWGRINKPGDVLKIGDKIKVYILNVDKESKKISLSMKKLIEDPWSNVDVKYPVGNIVLGKVVRFANFGAFVELEPGIDGLVHISQITHKRINKPEEALQIGETIKAKILDVSKENKKIGLSIKEVVEI